MHKHALLRDTCVHPVATASAHGSPGTCELVQQVQDQLQHRLPALTKCLRPLNACPLIKEGNE